MSVTNGEGVSACFGTDAGRGFVDSETEDWNAMRCVSEWEG